MPGLHPLGRVLMPAHRSATREPMLLQAGSIKEAVIDAMSHGLILIRRTAHAKKADGVTPAVLKQVFQPQLLEFIRPDAVGVWPWFLH